MSEIPSVEDDAGSLRPGTVVRYIPAPRYEGDRDPRWCREGIAIANTRGRLVDTYWGSGGEAHFVNDSERPSVEVLFHLDDFDELDRYRPGRQKWLTYAPKDRQRITMQHGHQERLFIRKGATPDRSTLIANARERVTDAEGKVRSAQGDLRWAEEDLAALLAAPDECLCRPSLCEKECPACTDDWRECKAMPERMRPHPIPPASDVTR